MTDWSCRHSCSQLQPLQLLPTFRPPCIPPCFRNTSLLDVFLVLQRKRWSGVFAPINRYNAVQRKQKRSAKLDLLEKAVSILWPCHLSCQLTVLVDTKLVTTPETEQCHLVNLHKYNHQNSPFYTNLLLVVGMDFTLGHRGLRVSCKKQVLNIHEKHHCTVLWHKLKSSWNHQNDSSIWTDWLW
jgi:hypothetical protein